MAVPPISIAAVFYGRFLKTLSRKTQKAVGEMVAVSEERLGAIRTVQAFNAVEPTETKRFKEKVDQIYALSKTEAWASGEYTSKHLQLLSLTALICRTLLRRCWVRG